jgi:ferredoxin--NADP+ reductase
VDQPDVSSTDYDLAIIGANRSGLSVALDAFEGGVKRIVIIDAKARPLPELGGEPETRFGTPVTRITEGEEVIIEGEGLSLTARVAVVAAGFAKQSRKPDYEIPASLTDRIHFEMPADVPPGDDILVVGVGESGAEQCESLVASGYTGVVLSLPSTSFDSLATLVRQDLLEIESSRRAAILWMAHPEEVIDVDGFPMVTFSDRGTPDLQFDRIIYDLGGADLAGRLKRIGITLQSEHDGPAAVYVLSDQDHSPSETAASGFATVSPGHAWQAVHDDHFPDLAGARDLEARPSLVREGLAEKLREQHYNATITEFENHHSDLWILRVKPDVGDASHQPGQYATLALGYWEARLDGEDEHLDEAKVEKLVRRSYSISHPLLDANDKLLAPEDIDGVEYYIVLVRPGGMDHLSELTPRLALKEKGDRIFMGAKVAGRYTLKPVTDPTMDVVFLSTGTGEAPHNNMTAQLLRDGHTGRIVSACTVRYKRDLAYLETHRRMEKLYSNYSYFPLTTREADTINNKVYIQDMITNGMLADVLGHEPTPGQTQFFLCGNPAMIGIPEWADDTPTFPETVGVCQILYERGFTIDHRGVEGNVHYEEYW